MCLLGINSTWAGPYLYFNECPQLPYGTTTFDYTSVALRTSGSGNGVPLDYETYQMSDHKILGLVSNNFTNAHVGDIIRINVEGNSSQSVVFKKWGSYENYSAFEDNKTSGSGYYQAAIPNNDVLNDIKGGNKLALYVNNGWNVTSIQLLSPSASTDNLTWTAEPYGITITGGFSSVSNNVYTLNNPSGFTFSGTGYIVITCQNGDGLKASYLITVLKENQKRFWDFTKHQLVVGPDKSNNTWRLANDSQWELYNYNMYGNTEWAFRFIGSINNTVTKDIVAETNGGTYGAEQRILYINEGNYGESGYENNGYNKLSIRNGGTVNAADHSVDRFVAVAQGVTVKIPDLKAGDRVRMRIDKYGEILNLNLTNAQDATGKFINSDYRIGGSGDLSNNKDEMKAYYNFIVDHDGDFTFKQTNNGVLLRLYDIEVYTGDFNMSNEVLSTKSEYTITNPYGTENSRNPEYHMHFRGKAEPNLELAWVLSTGNLKLEKTDFTVTKTDPNDGTTYSDDHVFLDKSSIKDKFGAFKIRLYVKDATGNYVTDYADRTMSVGYYENVEHPYTWDFTDLERFSASLMEKDYNNYHYNTNIYNDGKAQLDAEEDMNNWMIWKGERAFNYQRTSYPKGAMFAWGSQLYAYDQMIPESRGIAFTPLHMSNGSITLSTEGLKIDGGYNDPYSYDASAYGDINSRTDGGYGNFTSEKQWIWEMPWGPQTNVYPAPLNYDSSKKSDPRIGWRLTIPALPNLTAVYIRVKTIADKTPKLTLDFVRTDDNNGTPTPNPSAKWNFFRRIVDNPDGTKDIIIGVSPTFSGTPEPFSFILNNVILKKIATSKDLKAEFGQTGYQTESRSRIIDHRLTSFFTNEDIETFYGTLGTNDAGEQVVVLHHVDIMDKAADDNNNGNGVGFDACKASPDVEGKGVIMYHRNGLNTTDKNGNPQINRSLSMIDGGVHLFVPDMHDLDAETGEEDLGGPDVTTGNILWARFYNANTWDRFARVPQSEPGIAEKSGDAINYILSASHYNYKDESTEKGNGFDVGFYHVDKKGASMAVHSSYIRMGNNTSQSKVFLAFDDNFFMEEIQGIATKIDNANESNNASKVNGYFTLSGVSINKPVNKGLYIKNGKKVIVK